MTASLLIDVRWNGQFDMKWTTCFTYPGSKFRLLTWSLQVDQFHRLRRWNVQIENSSHVYSWRPPLPSPPANLIHALKQSQKLLTRLLTPSIASTIGSTGGTSRPWSSGRLVLCTEGKFGISSRKSGLTVDCHPAPGTEMLFGAGCRGFNVTWPLTLGKKLLEPSININCGFSSMVTKRGCFKEFITLTVILLIFALRNTHNRRLSKDHRCPEYLTTRITGKIEGCHSPITIMFTASSIRVSSCGDLNLTPTFPWVNLTSRGSTSVSMFLAGPLQEGSGLSQCRYSCKARI